MTKLQVLVLSLGAIDVLFVVLALGGIYTSAAAGNPTVALMNGIACAWMGGSLAMAFAAYRAESAAKEEE